MAIGANGIVSIVELIVYIPALIAAIIVCSRHGIHRSSGWIYTVILCVVRIAGAICQLLAINNPTDVSLLKATIIIDSIGISPLLLATLGVVSRFVDWINFSGSELFSTKQFRLVQVLITVGLILSIVGGTSGSSSDDGQVMVSTVSKVGIVLFIVAFVGITYFLVVSLGYRNTVPAQERRSSVAVAVAWPLILTRLVYSVLALFLDNSTFSIIGGNVGVHAALAVVEEFLVVIDYLILGFSLRRLEPEQQGSLAHRPWKEPRARSNRRRGQSAGREGA
ncbi:hypothetical protein F5Y14DRAFT_448287 [Nemania sp. NC0429]|nr:hypothetical protein F5Y14DRAFT_448287 [Nemania sp. NC0429]